MTAIYQQAGAEIPAILTKREAADYLRCTTKCIDNHIRAGRLRVLKPSRKLLRIRAADLQRFLEGGAV